MPPYNLLVTSTVLYCPPCAASWDDSHHVNDESCQRLLATHLRLVRVVSASTASTARSNITCLAACTAAMLKTATLNYYATLLLHGTGMRRQAAANIHTGGHRSCTSCRQSLYSTRLQRIDMVLPRLLRHSGIFSLCLIKCKSWNTHAASVKLDDTDCPPRTWQSRRARSRGWATDPVFAALALRQRIRMEHGRQCCGAQRRALAAASAGGSGRVVEGQPRAELMQVLGLKTCKCVRNVYSPQCSIMLVCASIS
jgi:hypothetical protein